MQKKSILKMLFVVSALLSILLVAGCSENADDSSGANENKIVNKGDSGTAIVDLAAPKNVEAEAETSSSVNVSWDSVTGAVSYVVYYREYGDISSENYKINGTELSCSTSSTSVLISNLQSNTTYLFWVKAKNSYGLGDCSVFGYARTKSSSSGSSTTSAPSAPTGLSASAKGRVISVSWNSMSGAMYYYLYICSSRTSSPESDNIYYRAALTENSYTVPDSDAFSYFDFNKTYYIYVKARGTGGYSSFSNLSVTTEKAVVAEDNLKIVNDSSYYIKNVYFFDTIDTNRLSSAKTSFTCSLKSNKTETFSLDSTIKFKKIIFITDVYEEYAYINTFTPPSSGMKTITITDSNLDYIGDLR